MDACEFANRSMDSRLNGTYAHKNTNGNNFHVFQIYTFSTLQAIHMYTLVYEVSDCMFMIHVL